MFPRVIAIIIGEYAAGVFLRDWIDLASIPKRFLIHLYANPNAYRAGLINFADQSEEKRRYIVRNPEAADIIKLNYGLYTPYMEKWRNPALIDFLLDQHGEPNDGYAAHFLMYNNNKKAAEILMPKMKRLTAESNIWSYLAHSNPAMMPWIIENMDPTNTTIYANPAAIDIIRARTGPISYMWLTNNPHPWAIENLRIRHQSYAMNHDFLANPGIFVEYTDIEIAEAVLAQ